MEAFALTELSGPTANQVRKTEQIFLFVCFGCAMRHVGSSVSQSGIKPALPAVEAQSHNHWTTRKSRESKLRKISAPPLPPLPPPLKVSSPGPDGVLEWCSARERSVCSTEMHPPGCGFAGPI